MSEHAFVQWFTRAAGFSPYAYQRRLAASDALPTIWSLPTGVGKTLAAVLTWLWRRRGSEDVALREATPRRLVYCLPTRALVEQTYAVCGQVLRNLGLLEGPARVRLHLVMGGHADDEWVLHPEDDAIVIGTQDMLLSRALNRGFGMSRFRWPMAFALLNVDCLWVCDEVQLMGAGLATSRQLQAFRDGPLGKGARAQTVWMSATLQPEWLDTVDNPMDGTQPVFRLQGDELEELAAVLRAKKTLRRGLPRKADDEADVARWLLGVHQPGTQTLVVVNRVERAQNIYRALQQQIRKNRHGPQTLLTHSRFRPPDRLRVYHELTSGSVPDEGRIVVSTQVAEAGLDFTSDRLVTDLAPWASLVQRFGRCNRDGSSRVGEVYWLDVASKDSAPYAAEDLDVAREVLAGLEGKSVAPADLPSVAAGAPLCDWLRRRDFVQLFDTSPDLSGNDVDVSRFIRSADDEGAAVFWRRVEEDGPNGAQAGAAQPAPHRDELCPVPLGGLRDFLERQTTRAWVWDFLADRWVPAQARHVRPGLQLLIACASGGYSAELGWGVTLSQPVDELSRPTGDAADATGADPESFARVWQTIAEHTDQVVAELSAILDRLPVRDEERRALLEAARHHDWGKAHPVFQQTMLKSGEPPRRNQQDGSSPIDTLWAKSGGATRVRHWPPHFRHELASALAYLETHLDQGMAADLVAYLIAAHHGKVRVAIRSAPAEFEGVVPGRAAGAEVAVAADSARSILGVAEGETLPAVDLGGGGVAPPVSLSLGPVEVGRTERWGRSWTDRVLGLLDADTGLGPMRLAFLETLLRAADMRASAAAVRAADGTAEAGTGTPDKGGDER